MDRASMILLEVVPIKIEACFSSCFSFMLLSSIRVLGIVIFLSFVSSIKVVRRINRVRSEASLLERIERAYPSGKGYQ